MILNLIKANAAYLHGFEKTANDEQHISKQMY